MHADILSTLKLTDCPNRFGLPVVVGCSWRVCLDTRGQSVHHLPMQQTHTSIIDLWPSLQEFAADLNVSVDRVRKWRERGRIPSHEWANIVTAASGRGIAVDLSTLAMAVRRIDGSHRSMINKREYSCDDLNISGKDN